MESTKLTGGEVYEFDNSTLTINNSEVPAPLSIYNALSFPEAALK